MIYEVTGDILLSKAEAIAHGVSPNDHFDNGLALSLRERWPSMAKDFRHYAHQTHPKPGEIWVWGGVGGIRIFNLLTQEGELVHGAKSGRATLPNINHCLRRLRHSLDKEKVSSLALPQLATGVGGMQWAEVYPLIKNHLSDLSIPIYIYATYQKGQQAQELNLQDK
jgi:O-acetyl-ADP-ribose deacetylase (regulator of RNase III)